MEASRLANACSRTRKSRAADAGVRLHESHEHVFFKMPNLRIIATILFFGVASTCLAAQEGKYPLIKFDDLPEAEFQCFLLSELLSTTANAKSSGADISAFKNDIKKILAPKYHNLGLEMVDKVYSGDPITEETRTDYFRRCAGNSIAAERKHLVASCYQAQREIDKFRLLKKQGITEDQIEGAIMSSNVTELDKKLFTIILHKVYNGEDTNYFKFKVGTWAGCTSIIKPK